MTAKPAPTPGRAVPPAAGPPEPQRKTVFEVFYERYQNTWRHYAYLHTGDRAAAEQIVDRFTGRLMQNWEQALQQRSVTNFAWGLFKSVVAQWLAEADTSPKLVQTAAFDRATRAAMAYCRGQFEAMEESLGLYSAIARLPERQADVIILRFVMGYSDAKVAEILGMAEPSVRSNLRHARNRLEPVAAQLRLLHTTENER